MSAPELEFINNFITLGTLNTPALPAEYRKPLSEVTQLGVALPALKYRYRARKQVSADESSASKKIKLTLKSIRAPKFSIEQEFPAHETIGFVKQFLIEEGKAQAIEQLKLLLKGKVLHNTVLLSDPKLDGAVLTVMITKLADNPTLETHTSTSGEGSFATATASFTDEFDNVTTKHSSSGDTDLQSHAENILTDLNNDKSEIPWDEIEILLSSKGIDDDEVNKMMEQLKRGWILAGKN